MFFLAAAERKSLRKAAKADVTDDTDSWLDSSSPGSSMRKTEKSGESALVETAIKARAVGSSESTSDSMASRWIGASCSVTSAH